MPYQVTFRPYRRPFTVPLQTHHGLWQRREGILLRLVDEAGRIGWGEIAPIPWFGTETMAEAWSFCQRLQGTISDAAIAEIPDTLPCCQFGFESAEADLDAAQVDSSFQQSGLLPAGDAVLTTWQHLWQQGYRTLKWKIGVQPIAVELPLLHTLLHQLPPAVKLRLDANGALSLEEAHRWLEACDRCYADPSLATVEFLEQPLPPEQLDAMRRLRQQHLTPIALDESVATLPQLRRCYDSGWQGIGIVKPAIVGSPAALKHFCRTYQPDLVFSSALETAIGRAAGLRLAAEYSNPARAIGYGVDHWFAESDSLVEPQWQIPSPC